MQGREPYPYPNALIIAENLLLYCNIVEWLLNVKRVNCVVLCCVARSCSDIKAVLLPIAGCLLALHYVIFLFLAFRTIYYT